MMTRWWRKAAEGSWRLEGMSLTVVGNAHSAQSILATGEAFDLMLTDIKMPKTDGFQLIAQAKAVYPGLKVLMMTGYLTPETVEQGRQSGADGFIAKPFTPDELVAAVHSTAS
jgi:CheY-like chemotaxis protein